jgi:hypothetical protein
MAHDAVLSSAAETAGHGPWFDDPQRVASLAGAFLAEAR